MPALSSGILVVDKPGGPTSHDVVRWVRRALGTRAVGHTGTLDPMASGVLVIAVGEGTKLVPWLTENDKRYLATIALGAQTNTLDAEGDVIERAPVPVLEMDVVCETARSFVGVHQQIPPAFSAIKVDGRPLYERARRGEDVVPAPREVVLHDLIVHRVEAASIDVELHTGKGYYVRSFARDFARALGTCGHLTALRRTQSGSFAIEGSLDGSILERGGGDAARAALRSLADACAWMPRVDLDEAGSRDAFHGRGIDEANVIAGATTRGQEPIAIFAANGELTAVGSWKGDFLKVLRGIRDHAPSP